MGGDKLSLSAIIESNLYLSGPANGLNYFILTSEVLFYGLDKLALSGKMVRCRPNVLYHLLKKIDKEPNADLFSFMKGNSHQRTEEEIKFVFNHLGWSYSLVQLD